MTNVGIPFEILENNKHPPVGWSKVKGHLIFDAKMDFIRKARCAGIVSRESVRIAFTYAVLNNLGVWAGDI
eukprot:15365069-Ditylum_brightwellii.AAC.3